MARTKRKVNPVIPEVVAAAPAGQRFFRAGGYVRLSVEDSGKADSDTIEAQKEYVRSYIENRDDLVFCGLYCDNGCTGTNFERPAFERMMADIRGRALDCVVVKDLSRFGRNYKETGNYLLRIFPFLGVRFISINDNFDTDTAECNEYGLIIPLKNMLNETYSRDISRKTASAIETKELQGEFRGPFAPYGYIKDATDHTKLKIDPNTAPVIREIFELRAGGMGYSGIVRLLNERGTPSPGANLVQTGQSPREDYRNALWKVETVKKILSNQVYLGHLVQGMRAQAAYKQPWNTRLAPREKWRVVCNTHEPIVDEETFTAVQKLAEERKTIAAAQRGKADDLKTPNLFLRLIYCADCGKPMNRRHVYNRSGGKRTYYYNYQCPTWQRMRSACTAKNLMERELLVVVRDTIYNHLKAISRLEARIKEEWDAKASHQRQEFQRQVDAAERELACTQLYLDGLCENMLSGMIDREEYISMKHHYLAKREETGRRLEEWKCKLQEFDRRGPSNPIFAVDRSFLDDGELSAELIRTLIERIEVHEDNRLDIKLVYRDEFQALSRLVEG